MFPFRKETGKGEDWFKISKEVRKRDKEALKIVRDVYVGANGIEWKGLTREQKNGVYQDIKQLLETLEQKIETGNKTAKNVSKTLGDKGYNADEAYKMVCLLLRRADPDYLTGNKKTKTPEKRRQVRNVSFVEFKKRIRPGPTPKPGPEPEPEPTRQRSRLRRRRVGGFNICPLMPILIIGMIVSAIIGSPWFFGAFFFWTIWCLLPAPRDPIEGATRHIRDIQRFRERGYITAEEMTEEIRSEIAIARMLEMKQGRALLNQFVGRRSARQIPNLLGFICFSLAFITFPLLKPLGIIVMMISYFMVEK